MPETFTPVRPPASENKPNLLSRICGQPPRFSPERQMLAWLMFFTAVTCWLSALWNHMMGIPDIAVLAIGGAVWLGLYYLIRVRHSPVILVGNLAFAFVLVELSAGWLANAGIDGSTLFFYMSTIVATAAVFKGRLRLAWISVLFGHVAIMIMLQSLRPDWVVAYSSTDIRHFDIAFSFCLIAVYLLGYVGINTYNLEERRKLGDALLLNILPDVIAEKLKYSPTQVIAEDHANASILFADIVEFTPLSANLMPSAVVDLLNSIFSYFDSLTDKYGVEKIKTIGDCYMVAAGVPTEQADHAQILTRLALEMRDYVTTHDFQGKRISLRIGINSGSVVAGVIGHKKFSYDMWGDAVNTASRMESHGRANAIQVTGNTYELIKDDFLCQPQGCIDVKGKGLMEVWHVMAARNGEGSRSLASSSPRWPGASWTRSNG